MIFLWQRIVAGLTAIIADLAVIYFIAPQLFITYGNSVFIWILEIAVLVIVYILMAKLFKHINKISYAKDWAQENSELTTTSSGEVYKPSEKTIIFNSVSELINKDNIADLHYTTLLVDGYLVFEGTKKYIVDKTDDTNARLEISFDGEVPDVVKDEKNRYKGTLMVENGRTFMQWTTLCK